MTVERSGKKEAYFPELDGLRTAGFIAVFLAHLRPTRAECSLLSGWMEWIGFSIEVFFVLSGFLITYLLLKEKRDFGSISLKDFYMRRILRIWPVYYLIVAGMTVGPLFFANWARMDLYWRYLRETILPYCLFVGNYSLIFDLGAMGGFFQGWHLPGARLAVVLIPLWSVCVEEQFYLVWPLLLFFIKRTRTMFFTAAALIVASICSLYLLRQFAWLSGNGYVYFYFNTPTHVASLMLGAAIAIAEIRCPGWAQNLFVGWRGGLTLALLVAACAAMCTWATSIYACRSSSVWLLTFITFASGVLMLLTLYWRPLKAFFSNSLLVRLSKLTYAMYVFHFVIAGVSGAWVAQFVARGTTLFWLCHMALAFTLTWCAAQLSWNLLESRMLALRKHFRRERRRLVSADSADELFKTDGREPPLFGGDIQEQSLISSGSCTR